MAVTDLGSVGDGTRSGRRPDRLAPAYLVLGVPDRAAVPPLKRGQWQYEHAEHAA
jgi:hypothetical protein